MNTCWSILHPDPLHAPLKFDDPAQLQEILDFAYEYESKLRRLHPIPNPQPAPESESDYDPNDYNNWDDYDS